MIMSHFLQLGTIFQFHKGTIKTSRNRDTKMLLNHFNSIKVRLKLKGKLVKNCLFRNFNSIKVRLKLHFHIIIVAVI